MRCSRRATLATTRIASRAMCRCAVQAAAFLLLVVSAQGPDQQQWKALRREANAQQDGAFTSDWTAGEQLSWMQFKPLLHMGYGPGQMAFLEPPRLGDKCFDGPIPGGDKTQCTYRAGPVRPQCCCVKTQYKSKKQKTGPFQTLICLPSFIVIGSQKSGSTALLAHFLLHPNVRCCCTAPAVCRRVPPCAAVCRRVPPCAWLMRLLCDWQEKEELPVFRFGRTP